MRSAKKRWGKPSKATSCGAKQKLTKVQAVASARRQRRELARRVSGYRCIYDDCRLADGSRAWHVGH